MRNFSASQLVKCSASQLAYCMLKNTSTPVTDRMHEGNVYSSSVVTSNKASDEKRGTVNIGDDLLFFCIDYVKSPIYAEIKMVKGEYEQWYFKSSILQSVLYASLLEMVTYLDTPKFKMKQGCEQEIVNVTAFQLFQLWFGKDKYAVKANENILMHYINKMRVVNKTLSTKDWQYARKFDAKFKWKEFDIYHPEFKLL